MPTPKHHKKTVQAKPKKGRPFASNPAATYADKSYIVTTFRLSKVAVAQADALDEFMQLGSRTAAVQYALGEVFKGVRDQTTPSGKPLMKVMQAKLEALGGEP
jgi:hypothetical protein